MEREALIQQLSEGFAVALRLRDAGASDETIAVALGTPVESVQATLRIAEAKLAELAAAGRPALPPEP